jgi:excinuclease ABC subunit B
MSMHEIQQAIVEVEEEMLAAAEDLRFEYAAQLRDDLRGLRASVDVQSAP